MMDDGSTKWISPKFGMQAAKEDWWRNRPDCVEFKHRLIMTLGRLPGSSLCRRIDIFQASPRSWPVFSLYLSSSVWFNRKIRQYAEEIGFKLCNSAAGRVLPDKSVVPLDHCKTQQDIFKELGIPYLRPDQRNY